MKSCWNILNVKVTLHSNKRSFYISYCFKIFVVVVVAVVVVVVVVVVVIIFFDT